MTTTGKIVTALVMLIGLTLGLTAESWNPYARAVSTPGQVVDESAIPDHGARYEDGSYDDGYCTPGAYCDDTVTVQREDDHR